MPLKIELGPFERIIIGHSVITNSNARTSFMISGDTPLLRERDALTAEAADTPVKRIYFCVQMMYLENDIPRYQAQYFAFVKDLLEAVPSARDAIASASKLILSGAYYRALKEIGKLRKREAKQWCQ